MTSYILDTIVYGRAEKRLDVKAMTTDIAAALGAELDVEWSGEMSDYQPGRMFLDDLAVYVGKDQKGSGTVIQRGYASAGARPEVSRALAGQMRRIEYPRITFDPSRPLDQIVKAIKTKVVDASAAPLKSELDYYASMNASNAAIRAVAAKFIAEFPFARVEIKDERAYDASVYANAEGCYLTGRLNSDGGLYIDRSSFPASRTAAVMAAMFGKG